MTKHARILRIAMERALDNFRTGRMSAEAAAEVAGVSLFEMLERIREAQIPYRLDGDVLDAIAAIDDQKPGPAISR